MPLAIGCASLGSLLTPPVSSPHAADRRRNAAAALLSRSCLRVSISSTVSPRASQSQAMEAAVTPITPELESFSPLDGARAGRRGDDPPRAVQSVVDDVASVQPFWAQLPLPDRARYMRRAGAGDHRPARRPRPAAQPRAGQADQRVVRDGAAAVDRLAALAGRGGARDPRGRAHAAAGLHQAEAGALHVRAARRGRRDRALELPLGDPVRRGGDRADGGQRRRAQAGVADAADRPAHPGGVRAGRRARGARAHRPRRRRGGPGAGRVERRQDLLHGLGRGRPARGRGVRAAA